MRREALLTLAVAITALGLLIHLLTHLIGAL